MLALLRVAGLATSVLVLLAANAQAQRLAPTAAPAPAPAPTLSVAAGAARANLSQLDPPDIAARYRVTLALRGQPVRVQQWQLSRSSTEISWIKGPALIEIWRRDSSGIRLERLLPQDQHLIDYSAGELRTLQVALDWPTLGSLIAPADLATLRLQRPSGPAMPYRSYQGRLGQDSIALRWDPVALLPVRLLRRSAAGQVLIERTAVHPSTPADWPPADAGSADYQRLDASDFGDMGYNPVVQRAQARDVLAGWRQPHHD